MASIFLGTTAIKDFWDLDHPNFLLAGEWCKIYGDAVAKDLRTLPYLWQDVKDVYKAQQYCDKVYESALVSITQLLNKHLKLNQKPHYYRILLGNWLIHFIHQAYDKSQIFHNAKAYGELETWVMEPNQYHYPEDCSDFFGSSSDDFYQLQLFSQVAQYLGVNTETKILKESSILYASNIDNGLIQKMFKNFKHSIRSLIYFFYKIFSRKNVIIVEPYFKRKGHIFEFLLWLKSKGKITFDPFNYPLNNHPREIDFEFRNSIKVASNLFEDWIIAFAIKNIPICYLELHHKNILNVKDLYKGKRLKFFTYTGLYHNIQFQFYIALYHEKHKIMSAQHGGAYGMDLRHEGEVFERSVANTFFTYGWVDSEQTRPLPMPKLVKTRNRSNQFDKVLFLTSTRTRYTVRFIQAPCSTKMLIDHVAFPIKFLNEVNVLDKIVIRHNPSIDYQWNNRQRIKTEFPSLKEDSNKSFYRTLKTSRIFVTDHLGTTYLEALQANVPTIILINSTSYLFRDSFKKYIDKLIQNNILFYEPVKAGIHLNSIYNDVDKWWGNESVQQTRTDFINTYALTSNHWKNKWSNELLST